MALGRLGSGSILKPSLQILDNLPEVDEERTPEELRINALVDPLPRLTDGSWTGVDIERFVPKAPEDKAATPIGVLGGTRSDGSATRASLADVAHIRLHGRVRPDISISLAAGVFQYETIGFTRSEARVGGVQWRLERADEHGDRALNGTAESSGRSGFLA